MKTIIGCLNFFQKTPKTRGLFQFENFQKDKNLDSGFVEKKKKLKPQGSLISEQEVIT
jgi:hypothetical protein